MNVIKNTYYLTMRNIKAQLRVPVFLLFGLAQPILWLVLFSQLFQNQVKMMGQLAAQSGGANPYGTNSFLDFFVPAIILQNVLFGAAWSGTLLINDMDSGVLDKMLATPVSRVAIVLARILGSVVTLLMQIVVLLLVALIMGFRMQSALAAVLIAFAVALLFGMGIAGLSNLVAILTRRSEAVMSVSTFITMPLFMLSSSFLPLALIGGWVETVAKFNPLYWGVEAVRQPVLNANVDWGTVGIAFAILGVIAVVFVTLAANAFRVRTAV